MRKIFSIFSLFIYSSTLLLIFALLQGCKFDQDSQSPDYAADPHCSLIVQQMHAYDAVNQPSKKITPIEQAKMLKEYQAYNCDNVSNKPNS